MIRLIVLFVLITLAPVVGKKYLGDTSLSDLKTDEIIVLGQATLKKVIAKSLSITGPFKAVDLSAEQLTITGPATILQGTFKSIHIIGPAQLANIKTDQMVVTGFVDATNVNVFESLEIIGMLNATTSKFNHITLTCDISVMKDSTAKSIVVKRPNSRPDHAPQQLKLYGNTRIDQVTFESGLGEVHIHGNDVHVSNVSGGKTIRH